MSLHHVYQASLWFSESFRMVYKWFGNFRSGDMSPSDAERFGRSVEVTTPEIIEKNLCYDDRKVKARETAEAVGISNDRVHNILHKHLHREKTIRKMGAAFAHTGSKA